MKANVIFTAAIAALLIMIVSFLLNGSDQAFAQDVQDLKGIKPVILHASWDQQGTFVQFKDHKGNLYVVPRNRAFVIQDIQIKRGNIGGKFRFKGDPSDVEGRYYMQFTGGSPGTYLDTHHFESGIPFYNGEAVYADPYIWNPGHEILVILLGYEEAL